MLIELLRTLRLFHELYKIVQKDFIMQFGQERKNLDKILEL